MTIQDVINQLQQRKGRNLRIMEICGTHTAAIMQGGIRSLLPDNITLVSGPGCPVCITPASYIDKAIKLAKMPNTALYAFGDMLKVKGSVENLTEAKASGASVQFIYSPFDLLEFAEKNPDTMHIFAAVGFETTIPVYATLIKKAKERNFQNIQLLTALRTVIPALELILSSDHLIDGFIAPGHVSAIIGSQAFQSLAIEHKRPFTITGFQPNHILIAIRQLVDQIDHEKHDVKNFYSGVVEPRGNVTALEAISDVFEPVGALWRGIGTIPQSGLLLNKTYRAFDAGSLQLGDEPLQSSACMCTEVILGRIQPNECPLFGKVCNPKNAQGPCMVSHEGACGIWYQYAKK